MKKSSKPSRSKFFSSRKKNTRKNKKRGGEKRTSDTFVSDKSPSMFVEHRNR